jgi:serine/threonine protein kinase
VYTTKDGVLTLKIIDFGVSQIITNETFMSTAIGTPLYMAP